MTETTDATHEQSTEQLIQQAVALLNRNLATVYGQGDSLENIVRLLARHQRLTSDEHRAAEIARDRSMHRLFNHVPIVRFKAEQRRANQYIQALERVTNVLLGQLDAVTGLAAAAKTVKGQQAIKQTQLARTFMEQAETRYRDSETR